MKVFTHDDCLLHNPPHEILSGRLSQYFESPDRLSIIKEELNGADGFEISDDLDFDIDLKAHALKIHDPSYIEYLDTAYDAWVKHGGDETAIFPEAFPHAARPPAVAIDPAELNPIARAGLFCFDLSCPITKETPKAMWASLRVVLTAMKALRLGSSEGVFALCRPPGHHAMPSGCGGYCFINNIAVAARFVQHHFATLTSMKPKVAILDIDYHHGNGTQTAFYEDASVLYLSLHAADDYPYFTGFTKEKGEGNGEGFNVNIPLPKGSTDDNSYCYALGEVVSVLKDFSPEFLLVSLGVDTHIDDPISDFKITTAGYLRVGEIIGSLRLPTGFVMEGGYDLTSIGKNVRNVLTGFKSGSA